MLNKFKHNFIFFKNLKKINLLINSLLIKYLKKLKAFNLSNITSSNKFLLIFVAIIIFFLSYLSIPHAYDKLETKRELQSQFLEKFDLKLVISKNFKYKFFPRPHFILKDVSILKDYLKISDVKKIYIFVSLKNLFSLKDILINSVNLENANFNLNETNHDFFINLLNSDLSQNSLSIKNGNIFYKNSDDEVLFINKIKKMNYYYDLKELKNIFISENEIFNIPYSFKSYKNKEKIFSLIRFDFLNLKIKNELDYNNKNKKGSSDLFYGKNKSTVNYEISDNSFLFDYFDNSKNSNFFFKGRIELNPFFSKFTSETDEIDLSFLFNSNAIFVQLLKTELFNHKNLNIDLSINSKAIKEYRNFTKLSLNSKIQEGLIDLDNTKFSWKNYVNFQLTDTLVYVSDNQLILDGKVVVDIINSNEIYKFMLTPKKNRLKIKKVIFDINYNVDQKIMNLKNISIDNNKNKKVNQILENLIFKNEVIQNKVYIKSVFNKAINAYAG